MKHAKTRDARSRVTGAVTDLVIDVVAAVWRSPDASRTRARCAVCEATTIAIVHPGTGECLCPSHTVSALLLWPGARVLVPAREITVVQAAQIAGDQRAAWFTCLRCRGTRGPVEFLSWPDWSDDYQARSWCAECWTGISEGDVSMVMVAQVPPVDQPTCCLDLRQTRETARRWRPERSESLVPEVEGPEVEAGPGGGPVPCDANGPGPDGC